MYFPFSFRKEVSTKHDITSAEISYQFLALKVPVLRRNKATNSRTSTDPFSAATKTLVLDLPSHSHGHFAIGDNERNKTIVIFSSSLSPSGKRPVRMWCQVEKLWINYQVQGLSVQLKNGRLEVLELVALFLLKTETCDAKNSWEFLVDAIFCLVKIGFQKRGTNTK